MCVFFFLVEDMCVFSEAKLKHKKGKPLRLKYKRAGFCEGHIIHHIYINVPMLVSSSFL